MRASSCHAIKPDESIEVAQDVCDHVTERSKLDAPGSLTSRAEVVGEVARVAWRAGSCHVPRLLPELRSSYARLGFRPTWRTMESCFRSSRDNGCSRASCGLIIGGATSTCGEQTRVRSYRLAALRGAVTLSLSAEAESALAAAN
jgi:hypothetical protein